MNARLHVLPLFLACGMLVSAPLVRARPDRTSSVMPAYNLEDYTPACDDLAHLAYWATLDDWTALDIGLHPRRRASILRRDRPTHRQWQQARRKALAPDNVRPGIDPKYVQSVENTAGSAYGTSGAGDTGTLQEAQENALGTALDIHDACLRNKGRLVDHPPP